MKFFVCDLSNLLPQLILFTTSDISNTFLRLLLTKVTLLSIFNVAKLFSLINCDRDSHLRFMFILCKMMCISITDILTSSKTLKCKLTSGPDGVPGFVARDCAGALSAPLCHIFNLILQTGVFPILWKVARVCPILKKGEACVFENYRPISILCNFSKIFEVILYKYIFVNVRGLLSCDQHGFIAGRSCMSNLASFSQFFCSCLNEKSQADAIYAFRKHLIRSTIWFCLIK